MTDQKHDRRNISKTKAAGFWAVAALGLCLTTTANATLIDRGNGMLYDSALNITWLQDANYAKTSGYDADGRMDWNAAMTWASNLVFGGYDDWRLPTVTDIGTPGCNVALSGTECGYNVNTATSELAYMYHVNLGLQSYFNADGSVDPNWGIFGNSTLNGVDINSYGQKDIGLIKNLQSLSYWLGTEYALYPSEAWYFYPGIGYQGYAGKIVNVYAWAVRYGDVAQPQQQSATVPEPAPLALMGLGLVGLVATKRRQRAA